jgi:hypothetical protein
MRKRILIATGAVTAVMGLSASSAMADTPQPASAPNADGNGSPTADGHSSPGDTDYTAIWSGN